MTNSFSTFSYLMILSFKSNLVYSKKVILQLMQSVFAIYAFTFVWIAVKNAGGSATDISLEQLISYTVTSNIIVSLLPNGFISKLYESDINSGDISIKILRPVGIDIIYLSTTLGVICAKFITNALPLIVLSIIFNMLSFPNSIFVWSMYLFSFIMGFIIALLIDYIMGYLCFWVYKGNNIRHFIESVFSAFSGQIIPLNLLPSFFIVFSLLSPVRLIFYDPISILIGNMNISDYSNYLLRLFIWLVLLVGSTILLGKLSQKKLFVQGG